MPASSPLRLRRPLPPRSWSATDRSLAGPTYAIASGDTLSRLAARAYGDPMLYGFIADANWDALGGDPGEHRRRHVAHDPLRRRQRPGSDARGGRAERRRASRPRSPPRDRSSRRSSTRCSARWRSSPIRCSRRCSWPSPSRSTWSRRGASSRGRRISPTRSARRKAADQDWDESVRELAAAFPELVTRMSDNIDWTEQAGEAVVAQTDEVLAAIQRLRAKAQENGYLVDNEAQTVEEVNDKIVIAPATPASSTCPPTTARSSTRPRSPAPPVYHYGYGYDYVYHDDDDWEDALLRAASSSAAPSSSTRSSTTTTGTAGTATTTSTGMAATSPSTGTT